MGRVRILCIEDEPDMIEFLKLLLGRAGYDVIGADGGRQGLAAIRRELPDLVLLDLMMPDMDGADVLKHKRNDATIRDIPVIAVTALSTPIDELVWSRKAEIQGYVTKPFNRDGLLCSIERVLAGRGHQDLDDSQAEKTGRG